MDFGGRVYAGVPSGGIRSSNVWVIGGTGGVGTRGPYQKRVFVFRTKTRTKTRFPPARVLAALAKTRFESCRVLASATKTRFSEKRGLEAVVARAGVPGVR